MSASSPGTGPTPPRICAPSTSRCTASCFRVDCSRRSAGTTSRRSAAPDPMTPTGPAPKQEPGPLFVRSGATADRLVGDQNDHGTDDRAEESVLDGRVDAELVRGEDQTAQGPADVTA